MSGWSDDPTHWSLLLQSGQHGWTYFYERYRDPVVSLFRRGGLPAAQVDDLVQEFFLSSLQREFLNSADPNRGRFRAYLATAARRFLTSHYRASGRLKRSPKGREIVPLGEGVDVAAEGTLTPEEAFDLAWARGVLRRASEATEADYAARGKEVHAEAFRRKQAGESWPVIAAALESSEAAVRGWASRFGDKLARAVRAEIAGTVPNEAELDSELAYLSQVLERSG